MEVNHAAEWIATGSRRPGGPGNTVGALAGSPLTATSATENYPTFDGDGKLLSSLDHEAIDAQAVLVQPGDQKILVAGSAFVDGDWDFALVRYCTDGSLDNGVNCGAPGFGMGGRVITDFGGDFHDSAMDAALQPDGKIVVAGTSSRYPEFDMAVARYNPDGSLDTTFDGDGMVKVDFQNSDERGYAVVVQPDGKIVVAGVSYITTWGDFALARLCSNGALDDGANCGSPAFGTGGKVRTDFSGSSDWVSALAVYEGKIIAGGSGGNKDFAVARYDRTAAWIRASAPMVTDRQLRDRLGLWAGRRRANGWQDHSRWRRLCR